MFTRGRGVIASLRIAEQHIHPRRARYKFGHAFGDPSHERLEKMKKIKTIITKHFAKLGIDIDGNDTRKRYMGTRRVLIRHWNHVIAQRKRAGKQRSRKAVRIGCGRVKGKRTIRIGIVRTNDSAAIFSEHVNHPNTDTVCTHVRFVVRFHGSSLTWPSPIQYAETTGERTHYDDDVMAGGVKDVRRFARDIGVEVFIRLLASRLSSALLTGNALGTHTHKRAGASRRPWWINSRSVVARGQSPTVANRDGRRSRIAATLTTSRPRTYRERGQSELPSAPAVLLWSAAPAPRDHRRRRHHTENDRDDDDGSGGEDRFVRRVTFGFVFSLQCRAGPHAQCFVLFVGSRRPFVLFSCRRSSECVAAKHDHARLISQRRRTRCFSLRVAPKRRTSGLQDAATIPSGRPYRHGYVYWYEYIVKIIINS